MKIQNILCPVDFSETNANTIDYASKIAKGSGATLHFVHVTLPAVPFGAEHLYMTSVDVDQEIHRLMSEVRPSDPSLTYQHHILEGHPADAIVQFAKDHAIDLIVMSTHGRSGLARLLMGSVAESIIRRAHCPVLAVKQPSSSQQESE